MNNAKSRRSSECQYVQILRITTNSIIHMPDFIRFYRTPAIPKGGGTPFNPLPQGEGTFVGQLPEGEGARGAARGDGNKTSIKCSQQLLTRSKMWVKAGNATQEAEVLPA